MNQLLEVNQNELREFRILGRKPQTTRKIQLGWILNGKPVRQKRGGGSREISVSKSSRKADLMKISCDLFFPDGKSTFGKLIDFDYDLLDFQQSEINDQLTVGEIYEISKLNVLRFYLSTNEKEQKAKTAKSQKREIHTVTAVAADNNDIPGDTNVPDLASNTNDIVTYLNLWDDKDDDKGLYSNAIFEIDDIIEISPEPLSSYLPKSTTLKLHRGRVFDELVLAFENDITCTDIVIIEMILPNGNIEKGNDVVGVFRDCLSEFWETFYEKCTLGTNFKVPYIRHDFGEAQWKSIAKILIYGFRKEQYFPIKLAPSFVEHCVGISTEDRFLIEDFKKFVSESDCDVICEALSQFNENNQDILDFFSTYESKWLPTADNVQKLLRDIAHKELIQRPAFVGKCFAQEFNRSKIIEPCEIRNIYEKLKPSAKNCMAKLHLEEEEVLTEKKNEIFRYLKKFVKECDDRLRSLFFRFCTGADIPITDIKVAFIPTDSNFIRSPVAHTCTGLLELSLSYENYLELRNELNSILSSNIWVMDLI